MTGCFWFDYKFNSFHSIWTLSLLLMSSLPPPSFIYESRVYAHTVLCYAYIVWLLHLIEYYFFFCFCFFSSVIRGGIHLLGQQQWPAVGHITNERKGNNNKITIINIIIEWIQLTKCVFLLDLIVYTYGTAYAVVYSINTHKHTHMPS